MKIELRENPDGRLCLFDTRSEKFMKGGCVRDEESGQSLLDTANSVVRRSYKTILELAHNHIYSDDGGYLESMLAEAYININPDIIDKVYEKLENRVDRKTQRMGKGNGGRRGRPRIDRGEGFEENREGKKRGRPAKEKVEVEIDPNAVKRGRGRPRRIVDENAPLKQSTIPNAVKRSRGRPRKIVDENAPLKQPTIGESEQEYPDHGRLTGNL